MTRFIFLLILGTVGYLLYHLYGKKLKQKGPKSLIGTALLVVAVLLLLAVLTGRANAIFAVIGGLFAAVWRIAPLLAKFYPHLRPILNGHRSRQASGGQHSRVATAFLSMTINSSSGDIDGEILKGVYEGQILSALSAAELKQFYTSCQHDPQTLRLLNAYIRRKHPDWSTQQPSEPSDETLSEAQAWDILGLQPGASRDEIISAHRKLMMRLHPDKGGSTYLATRVNQAKDYLLKHTTPGH